MSDEAISSLTQAGITALHSGNHAEANKIFAERDAVAVETYGNEPVRSIGADGKVISPTESPSPSNANTESVSAESLDAIRDILSSTGNASMCDAGLGSTVEHALSFAQSFERANPALANEIADLASADPKVYAAVLKFAAAQGRSAPKAARANPDTSYRPEQPILSAQESIQDRIAALAVKLGTAEGRTTKFQKEWSMLHRQLHGDGPAVGHRGRTA